MAQAAVQGGVPPTSEVQRAADAARSAAADCHQVCDEVAVKTRAAEEAAARCVAASDNADAAWLVARAIRASGWHTPAGTAREDHYDSRSAAKAAALAAREASVLCAAKRRAAVAAALAARKAVQRHTAEGGHPQAQDVLAAEEAANLCVAVLGHDATEADRAAVAGRAVPRADAAAAAARQSAVSCDEALAGSSAEDDKKYLHNMRGWLMTVAALLINMSFMAIIHPPSWVPEDFGYRSDDDDGDTIPRVVRNMGITYLALNVGTFAIALTLLIMLLGMKKRAPAEALRIVTVTMKTLVGMVTLSFASATSSDPLVAGRTLTNIGVNVLVAVFMRHRINALSRFFWNSIEKLQDSAKFGISVRP